jgi:O-antigen/teichoic acid export membrane protein
VAPVLVMETGWYAVHLAAVWFLLHVAGAGVVALLWIAAVVQLLQIASALLMWRSAFDGEPVAAPPWAAAYDTFRRAVPFAAGGIIANLQMRVAPLMLGYLSTPSELGGFAAAARFATTARLAPGAIFAGALPVLSGEHERRDGDAERTFSSFDRALTLLAIATAAPLVLLARPLLRIAYGAAFAGAAATLSIVGLGLVPALTNSAAKIALYAADEEAAATAWSAVSLGVQIAAAFALMPRFGGAGAAAAIAIGEVIIAVPLRRARTAARTPRPSSRRRAPAPTIAPRATSVPDAPDPAAAR